MKQNMNTLKSVFTALFASVICAGAFIAIPIGSVPITLQNAFAVMAGLLLGPIQGAGAVGLFLVLGALGLPVFSGGRGGLAVLAGPTSGYLVGYFIAALVGGYAVERAYRSETDPDYRTVLPMVISATVMAFVVIYIPGILVLKKTLALGLADALAKGLLPFIAGDLAKIAILVPIVLKLRPVVQTYLNPND